MLILENYFVDIFSGFSVGCPISNCMIKNSLYLLCFYIIDHLNLI